MSLPLQKNYVCNICGKKFGDSLGDMERHVLIEHMQKGDLTFLNRR